MQTTPCIMPSSLQIVFAVAPEDIDWTLRVSRAEAVLHKQCAARCISRINIATINPHHNDWLEVEGTVCIIYHASSEISCSRFAQEQPANTCLLCVSGGLFDEIDTVLVTRYHYFRFTCAELGDASLGRWLAEWSKSNFETDKYILACKSLRDVPDRYIDLSEVTAELQSVIALRNSMPYDNQSSPEVAECDKLLEQSAVNLSDVITREHLTEFAKGQESISNIIAKTQERLFTTWTQRKSELLMGNNQLPVLVNALNKYLSQEQQSLSFHVKFRRVKHTSLQDLAVMMALAEMTVRNISYVEKFVLAVLSKCPLIVKLFEETCLDGLGFPEHIISEYAGVKNFVFNALAALTALSELVSSKRADVGELVETVLSKSPQIVEALRDMDDTIRAFIKTYSN